MTEVIIDQKSVHKGYMHGVIEKGGTFTFKNFPFGFHVESSPDKPFVWVKLFIIPTGDQELRKVEAIKLQPKEKPKKEEEIVIEEEENFEM